MLQIKNRSSIDAVFCNQRICCDLFLFHRPPQRAIINQTGTSSHDICLIIVGKEMLEYTEKCKYSTALMAYNVFLQQILQYKTQKPPVFTREVFAYIDDMRRK